MRRILLGPCSNKGEDGLQDRGGKRQSRAVNDSTGSAKDLISPGTHSSPASQTHCTSVVDVTVHSNIPIRDFTARNETKEESKQIAGAAIPKTAQPAKRSASSSLRAKALDEESPTIVTPTITTMHQPRPSPSEDAAAMTA